MRLLPQLLLISLAGVFITACGGDGADGSEQNPSNQPSQQSPSDQPSEPPAQGSLDEGSTCADWDKASSGDKRQVLVSLGWKEGAAPDIAKRIDDACSREGEALGNLKGQSDFLAGAFPDQRR